jgi:hypothetical protein
MPVEEDDKPDPLLPRNGERCTPNRLPVAATREVVAV